MKAIIIIIIAYLLGSIPFGYLICKFWKGIDVRDVGSGNIGATNVKRAAGLPAAILTFLGDFLKAVLAVSLAKAYCGEIAVCLAAMAVLLGHSFPLFLGFKGGKIISSGLGVIVTLSPLCAVGVILVWGVVTFISRYISLGSVVAAASLPIFMIIDKQPLAYIVLSLLIALLAVYRHKDNIRRIQNGMESKIGDKK